MSSEHAEEISQSLDSELPVTQSSRSQPAAAPTTGNNTGPVTGSTNQNAAAPQPATVIVRGEAVANPASKSSAATAPANTQKAVVPKKLSEAKAKLQSRLPSLDDYDDIGVQKEQIVVRDGKPDLAFTGTLLASAAPATAAKGHWEELRVYQTSAGKHVFSKIERTVYVEEQDECKAEIFDPAPSSTAAQLLRSAHDLTHAKPKTWKDAAVEFFGYEPLAKELYRKLGDQFEERVS
jgi:hypothetical protein